MARVDVVMPKMGESVMEGTVLEWKKAAGDVVELDETLLEISTDKVDSEVPSPSAGRLAEILVPEGETVEVGVPIAVIETDVDAEGGDAPAETPQEPSEEAAQPSAEEPEASEPSAPEASAPEPSAPEAAPAQPSEPSQPAPAPSAQASQPSAQPAQPSGGGQRVEVVMPKMGESVMEGTVLSWAKSVGDEVELDETLLEISTDKVDSEVPAPAAGRLAEILVPEGETVEVGVPIAVILVGAGDRVEPPEVPPTAETSAAAGPHDASVGVAPSTDDDAGRTAEGDGSGQGTAPSPAEKSYGFAGQELEGDGAPLAAPAEAQTEAAGPIPRRGEGGRFYSPLVRSIAEKEGLSMAELEGIEGSGAEGRVTKADLVGYLETRQAPAPPSAPPSAQPSAAEASPPAARQGGAAPPARPAAAPSAPPAEPASATDRVEVVEMDRMRQLISDHMRRSVDTSAHVTSFAEIDVTGLVRHREAHKKAFEAREGVKLTYTPYFLLAAVEPLREHPLLNSSVEGKRILVKKDFHIGVAVAIGTKGLLVPIVRDAGQQNLTGLTRSIADLASRARSKQLLPDELQGGTFTVTNVGSLGSLMGTPIINQPQVAILSPGAIVKRPVVVEHPDLGDAIAVRHMMYVSLSYDHRIIDGSMAASFLRAYRERVEAITAESELF